MNQIGENADEDSAVISGNVDHDAYGFDALNGEFKDIVNAGIIDPTKDVRTALQDAASVPGLLITTEAMLAERPEMEARAGRLRGKHLRRHSTRSCAQLKQMLWPPLESTSDAAALVRPGPRGTHLGRGPTS